MKLFHKHVLLLTVVPVLIISAGLTLYSQTLVRDRVLELRSAALVRELELHTEALNAFLNAHQRTLATLAQTPTMRSGLREQRLALLGTIEEQSEQRFERLYFYDLEGNVFTTDGRSIDVSDRLYYGRVLLGEPVISNLITSRDSGRQVVLLASPLRDSRDRVVGAVAGTVVVDSLLHRVTEIFYDEAGFAVLVDAQGAVLASGEPLPFEVSELIAPHRAPLPGGWHALDEDRYFCASVGLSSANWRLYLVVSRRDIFQPVRLLQAIGALVVAMAVLVSIVTGFLAWRQVGRPMASLLEGIRTYGTGRFEHRIAIDSHDEFGELAEAVNGMAEVLASRAAESKQSLEALAKSEEAFRTALEQLPIGVGMADSDDNILHVNRRFVEIFGYTVEEIPTVSHWWRLAYPDREQRRKTRSEWLAHYRTYREAGTPFAPIEFAAHCKDGALRYVEAAYSRANEHNIVTFVDRTPHREAERALLLRNDALRTAVSGIAFADFSYHLTYANDAAVRLWGYEDASEVVGRHTNELWVRTPEIDEAVAALDNGRAWIGEVRGKRKGQGAFDMRLSASIAKDENGTPLCLMASFEDISDRVRAQHEQEQLEHQLWQAQKMEAVGQLAGGVAHDFNNLLQIITGYTELARDACGDESDASPMLDEVARAAEGARKLVSQLLLFSRQQSVSLTILDVNEVLRELLRMVGRVLGEHIEHRLMPGDDVPRVYADRHQLEQAVINLCVNARDAMPEGGHLILSTERAQVDANTARRYGVEPGVFAVMSVSDNGPGIPPDLQDRVFEPFFTTKDVGEGTGLGLATVYGVMHRHGGFVTLESSPGEGAKFSVFLPETSESASTNVEAPVMVDADEAGEGELILFAEDDDAVRRLGVTLLRQSGFRVLVAHDGQEAIDLLTQHVDEVDLALLDVVMPRKSGRAVYEACRDLCPDLPVLFASGYSYNVLEMGGLNPEEYELVTKPFDRRTLIARVRHLIDGRERGPAGKAFDEA